MDRSSKVVNGVMSPNASERTPPNGALLQHPHLDHVAILDFDPCGVGISES